MSAETQTAIERITDVLIEHRDIVCVTGDPDVVARDILDHALSVEEMAHTLDGHRPVMSVLDGIIRITGCRCLDRVFFRNSGEVSESWEGHIAASLRTALLGADS